MWFKKAFSNIYLVITGLIVFLFFFVVVVVVAIVWLFLGYCGLFLAALKASIILYQKQGFTVS